MIPNGIFFIIAFIPSVFSQVTSNLTWMPIDVRKDHGSLILTPLKVVTKSPLRAATACEKSPGGYLKLIIFYKIIHYIFPQNIA